MLVDLDNEKHKVVDIRGQCGHTGTQGTDNGHYVDSGQRSYGSNWTISGGVRDFVGEHTGIFTNFDIDRELSLSTRNEKKARYEALNRLKKERKIKKLEGKPGTWRILNSQIEKVDFSAALKTPFSLPFPLGIGDLAQIYPGNVVMVSGTSNSGKTGFLMQTCVDTIHTYLPPSNTPPLSGTLSFI